MALFDAHLHIIDPRFPTVANDGFTPEPFTVQDYRERTAPLGVTGGAVVAGSYQGTDQEHLLAALREMGPTFVGVAQLPPDTSDSQLRDLHAAGVRALRFNLHRGMARDLDAQVQLGLRAADLLGWPSEFYIDSRMLPEISSLISPLPRVAVDHLGLSAEGLPALLDLVASGARVKATGFGRGDLDVPEALRAIAGVNPGALMFGTDLPSTRADRPFRDSDADLVAEALGADLAERALSTNAREFYGIASRAHVA